MYNKNEFDEYSNYDDRNNHHSKATPNKAAPKLGSTNTSSNKEEFGVEKFFKNLYSKVKNSYNNQNNNNNK